jgi:hypothetical protein
MGSEGFFPGVKWPGLEDNSTSTCAKVKKAWIYTSTPPYSFMVQFLISLAQGQLHLFFFTICIYIHVMLHRNLLDEEIEQVIYSEFPVKLILTYSLQQYCQHQQISLQPERKQNATVSSVLH